MCHMKNKQHPASLHVRATVEDWKLVDLLCEKLGVAPSQIVRLGLRALAIKEGVSY